MKNLSKSLLVLFFTLALHFSLCALSFADIPHLINYQGKLTDPSGAPVSDGTHSITFRIYDAETAGSLLWEETQSVTTQKGIFSVMLGGVTNLDLAFDKPYFLEIKVGTEVMSPRQQIASAGYAYRADKASNSDAVDSIHASALPEANKLLSLDAQAKLPASALKVYDSGWFGPINNGNYRDLNHNLGTTKAIFRLYSSKSADGSNPQTQDLLEGGVGDAKGAVIKNITATGYRVQTAQSSAFYGIKDNGAADAITFAYYRVIALALE